MPARPWFPFNPGDFYRDTAHLTLEQQGAYMRLLSFAWDHDGTIPADFRGMGNILGVHTNKAKTLWGFVGGYWYETQGGFRQKRLDREIAKCIDIVEKRAEAGRRGGLAKGLANTLANGKQSQPHKTEEKKDPPSVPAGGANGGSDPREEGFAEFYADYPRKEGKQDAKKAWRSLTKAEKDAAAEGVTGWPFPDDKKYMPLPASWLRGKRWEDGSEESSENYIPGIGHWQ